MKNSISYNNFFTLRFKCDKKTCYIYILILLKKDYNIQSFKFYKVKNYYKCLTLSQWDFASVWVQRRELVVGSW